MRPKIRIAGLMEKYNKDSLMHFSKAHNSLFSSDTAFEVLSIEAVKARRTGES